MRRVLPFLALFLGLCGSSMAQIYNFRPITAHINTFVGPDQEDLLTGASMIVIKDGKAIYKKSFGDYKNVAPRVAIASGSKWLSALVIQRLVDTGSMRWTDTVADYFGNDYPNASFVKGAITLRQLFTHTSGVTVEAATCLSVEYKNMALDDCAKTILSKQLSWAPGTLFAYGENSMQVAGAMAQRATAKTWAQLVETELTGPLEMKRTDFGVTERGTPFSNPTVAGGARSTMMDYANVVQMVLQRGEFNSTQYLSPESLAIMQRDQTGGVPTNPDADPFPASFGYGYGTWRNLVDCTGTAIEISATGVYGTSGWVNHEQGIAAVFFSWRQLPGGDILRDKITQLWALVRDVIDEPPQCPTR
ncbi:MAG: beta-lactamase family protein [Ideonella sp.]|nr:beta-lactamase family protein [Ideonella sp.]